MQKHAFPGFSSRPTPAKQVLLDNRSKRSLIKRCYEALLKGTKVNNEATLAIWEQDVGLSIDVDTWTQI